MHNVNCTGVALFPPPPTTTAQRTLPAARRAPRARARGTQPERRRARRVPRRGPNEPGSGGRRHGLARVARVALAACPPVMRDRRVPTPATHHPPTAHCLPQENVAADEHGCTQIRQRARRASEGDFPPTLLHPTTPPHPRSILSQSRGVRGGMRGLKKGGRGVGTKLERRHAGHAHAGCGT